MTQGKLMGMQHHPLRRDLKRIVPPGSVNRIPKDRQIRVPAMHPDLVRPPGLDVAHQPGMRQAEPLTHAPLRERRTPAAANHGHAMPLNRVPRDRALHHTRILPGHTAHEDTIDLANLPIMKGARQTPVRLIVLRHHDRPGCLPVQTMNDPRALHPADAAQARALGVAWIESQLRRPGDAARLRGVLMSEGVFNNPEVIIGQFRSLSAEDLRVAGQAFGASRRVEVVGR